MSSPDGRLVAFVSDRNGSDDLMIIPLAGGTPTFLTDDPSNDTHPAWSPDGMEIAFLSDRGGGMAIWTIDASGGDPRKLVSFDQRFVAPEFAWSPDGTQIAFEIPGSPQTAVGTMPSGGGTIVPFLPPSGSYSLGGWSPDGQLLACRHTGPEGTNIGLLVVATGEWRPLTNWDPRSYYTFTVPQWSVDGSRLLFATHTVWDVGAVQTVSVSGGAVDTLMVSPAISSEMLWTANGECLIGDLYRPDSGIYRVCTGDSEPTRVTPEAPALGGYHDLSWLPGETGVLCCSGRVGNPDIWVIRLP